MTMNYQQLVELAGDADLRGDRVAAARHYLAAANATGDKEQKAACLRSASLAAMKPLSELPRREGFRFRGIRKDGGHYMNCRLKSLPGEVWLVVAAGRYVYQDVSPELAGWEPHPKRRRS